MLDEFYTSNLDIFYYMLYNKLMRMRRKKNLDTRIVSHPNYLLFIETEEFYSKEESKKYNTFDVEEIFNNSNPLWLEIGCGKGQFALQTSKNNPDKNIIAVEKISNVILEALENAETL